MKPEITNNRFFVRGETYKNKLQYILVQQSGDGMWTLRGEPNPAFVVTSGIDLNFSIDDLDELQLVRQALNFMEDRIKNYKERTLKCPFCGSEMKESWNQKGWFKCQNLPKCHTFRHEDEIKELWEKKKGKIDAKKAIYSEQDAVMVCANCGKCVATVGWRKDVCECGQVMDWSE